jgi:7-carboxy-7-deazaguanine synthase
MSYSVKEIFYTLQGEGANAGRPAVFCRFTGPDLWSGLEEHRASAVCRFCDTDFVSINGTSGRKFEKAYQLANAIAEKWPVTGMTSPKPFVVCTGGVRISAKVTSRFGDGDRLMGVVLCGV